MPKIIFIDAANRKYTVEAPAGRSVMDAAVDNNVPGIAGECDGHFVQEDKGEEVAQALVEFIRAN